MKIELECLGVSISPVWREKSGLSVAPKVSWIGLEGRRLLESLNIWIVPRTWSAINDGGDVGLLVAMRRPDLVQRLVLIGSNFHHAGLIPIGEMSPDDPSGVYDMFATMYGECSPDGREHFDAFLAKTYAMWASEPELTPTDLAAVTVPVLVLVADDDAIALSHTCSLYESIPGAQLTVVPGASHLLPIEQPEETVHIIRRFLEASEPPATLMPTRRGLSRGRGHQVHWRRTSTGEC